MDRIDLQIEVPAVPFRDFAANTAGPPSSELRGQVIAVREIQAGRLANSGLFCNAQMTTSFTRRHCQLSRQGLSLLERAMERFKLSARAYAEY